MPPCFTVTGGQSFAEFAGVRKDMCLESGDRALQSLQVSAGCVPGILGQGFAEFAGIRRMCAGNPGKELCRICRCPQDMCRESGDRALRTSPESLACL